MIAQYKWQGGQQQETKIVDQLQFQLIIGLKGTGERTGQEQTEVEQYEDLHIMSGLYPLISQYEGYDRMSVYDQYGYR